MHRGKWYYYIVIFFKPMIESSSFGGSLSRLRLASESRGWWNRGSGYRCEWTHEGKPNGRKGRQGSKTGRTFLASCVLNSCLLGETYTVRYSGRVCQYVALRGVIFYATWVVPQELISCPILVGQEFFIFIGYTKLKTLLNLNTPLQADTCGTP